MIDSHCHLDHEPLLSDLSNIIKRSKDVGIKKLLTISTSLESFSKIKNIIDKDEMIYGTIGIHPHETNNEIISSNNIVKNFNENPKIIGIGETGLDFYYNNSDKDKQIKSFEEHIKASIELNIPLIVHSRNAENETFEIPHSYELLGPHDDNAVQMLYLRSFFDNRSVYEPWIQIELDEKPELFKEMNIDIYQLYDDNYAVIRDYYTPFINSIDNYLDHWNSNPDTMPPTRIENLTTTFDGEHYIKLNWIS